jgi:hypothetical protein
MDMRRSRFSEEQVIKVLKEPAAEIAAEGVGVTGPTEWSVSDVRICTQIVREN